MMDVHYLTDKKGRPKAVQIGIKELEGYKKGAGQSSFNQDFETSL
jgi:hypothetical protein